MAMHGLRGIHKAGYSPIVQVGEVGGDWDAWNACKHARVCAQGPQEMMHMQGCGRYTREASPSLWLPASMHPPCSCALTSICPPTDDLAIVHSSHCSVNAMWMQVHMTRHMVDIVA